MSGDNAGGGGHNGDSLRGEPGYWNPWTGQMQWEPPTQPAPAAPVPAPTAPPTDPAAPPEPSPADLLAALQGQYNTLNTNYGSLQEQLAALQGQYNTSQSSLGTLQGQYDTAQSNLGALQNQYSGLQNQFDATNSRNQFLAQQIGALSNKGDGGNVYTPTAHSSSAGLPQVNVVLRKPQPIRGVYTNADAQEQGITSLYGLGPMANFFPNRNDLIMPGEVPKKYMASGGLVRGPGTETSDSVPAMINGRQPAALSSGEFVFTGQAVRGMGEGDRMEGARRLHSMMKKAERRVQKGGKR